MIGNPRLAVTAAFTMLGWVCLVLFPPWQRDGVSAGHSFVLSPPAAYSAYSSHATIDWLTLGRSAILIGLVGAAIAVVVRQPSSDTRPRHFPSFGWRTLLVSSLLALVLPVPFAWSLPKGLLVFPPVGMWPLELYTRSNHGIPQVFIAEALWLILSIGIYLVLGIIGVFVRLRRSALSRRAGMRGIVRRSQ